MFYLARLENRPSCYSSGFGYCRGRIDYTDRWVTVVMFPIWAVQAGPLAYVAWAFRRRRRHRREQARRLAGRCPACDYDLTGNASGTCPECGAAAVAIAGA